jgi:hypothetical protein
MRQPNPAHTLPLSERVHCMDARSQILVSQSASQSVSRCVSCVCNCRTCTTHAPQVAATADKQMHVFDLNAGSKAGEFKSPLAYQTRSLAIFHDW